MRKIHTLFYVIIFPLFFLLACATKEPSSTIVQEDNSLSRPNPGYVQYVKNRSLLTEAQRLLASVSTSLHSYTNDKNDAKKLRDMAGVWLYINPSIYVTDIGTPLLRALDYADLLEMIKLTGVQGLYIAPLYGTSYLWTSKSKMSLYNQDPVQLEIAMDLGSAQDFSSLRTSLGNNDMFFGSSLLPVATGMGADFWLATRGVDQYAGLYSLIPLPKHLWQSMPMANKGSYIPLNSTDVKELVEEKIIPQPFAQDGLFYLKPSGWAITSEIIDIHGEPQRYIYRYYGNPSLPLLHLYNPNLDAMRILNANVVQSIGVYGSALVGFSILPYYSLADKNNLPDTFYTPIAEHLERMIQQYGAFAYIQDKLPLPLLSNLLKINKDVFIEDSITSPYAEYALLFQNTTLLKEMLSQAIEANIPIERLIHSTANEQGIELYPLSLYVMNQRNYINPKVEQEHNKILQSIHKLKREYPGITKNIPFTTPTLAAASLKYELHSNIKYDEKKHTTLLRAHASLLFFKAMLPGLLMVSAQDFAAPLPMTKEDYEKTGNPWKTSLAGYGGYTLQVLPYSTLINRFSIPMVQTLYPEFQTQDLTKDSFKQVAQTIFSLRKEFDIANTRLVQVLPTSDTTIAVLLQNDKGQKFIALTNFSNQDTTFRLPSQVLKKKLIPLYSSGNTQRYKNDYVLSSFASLLLQVQ